MGKCKGLYSFNQCQTKFYFAFPGEKLLNSELPQQWLRRDPIAEGKPQSSHGTIKLIKTQGHSFINTEMLMLLSKRRKVI